MPEQVRHDGKGYSRRLFLGATLAFPATAVAAKLAPTDPLVNAAAINWPVGLDRQLHGFMAIPASARGRQPAILVIGGSDTPDAFARQLVRSIAQAGFVACTANAAAILPDRLAEDMRATARWLAQGRYSTGRIGALGLGGGAATAEALTRDASLAACATLDPATGGWHLLTSAIVPDTFRSDWNDAWSRAIAFLREHLT